MARRDAATRDATPPPTRLQPLLRFRGRPAERTVRTVSDVLDGDDVFRGRVLEALGEVDDAEVDDVARLKLERPDGWEAQFASLVAAERAAEATREAVQADADLARQVDALSQALERREGELVAAGERERSVRAALDDERERRRLAEEAAAVARGQLDDLRVERERAVRELGEARSRADELAADVRALRHEFEQLRAPSTPLGPGPEELQAFGAVVDAASALTAAVERLGAAITEADAAASTGAGTVDAGSDGAGSNAAAAHAADGTGQREPAPRRTPRRLPVRLERGAVDGTPEAVDQLLRVPGAVVLVDGYNLSMASSPNLPIAVQRDQVVNLLTSAHARTGAEIHVVFDGGDVGERPSVQAPFGIRVHFSPSGVEADDVLIELVPSIDSDRAVVVVSSDARVRDGVRRFGANVVRSEDLLSWSRG